MAGSIGTVNCSFVKGQAPSLQQRIDPWEVQGVDGYGYMVGGKGRAAGAVRAIHYTTKALVSTWYNSLLAVQQAGLPVTVVNDMGTSFTNCLVMSISAPNITAAYVPGGSIEVCAEVHVSLLRVGA